jgi:hypothetical protein
VEPLLLIITIPLVMVVVLLAIPIEVNFDINRIEKIHGHVNLRWLFGLARFRIAIPTPPKKPKLKRNAVAAKAAAGHKQKSAPLKIFSALKQPAFRRRTYRFIKSLLRATHSHNLQLRIRIGLGDPADTGQLWALLGPVSAIAANLHHANVLIEPEFINTTIEFRSQGEFRLVPLEVILLVVAFMLSPPSLKAWRILRRGA